MNAPTQPTHVLPQVHQRPVPPALVEALKTRFGAQFSDALAVREQHGRDESAFTTVPPPAAVVFAESTADVQDAVRLCAQHRVPVIPYGVGSSLEGHLLAVQGGISIDVSRMNKVLSVNAEDLTVTVQPGVTREQLNAEIRSTGLFFPIDPGANASLGGMCATRASGTNAVRYGTMRENVLALQVVTAAGEAIRTGTRQKSSAGYDLTRLFVGSEGTLGVITEATLRVYPLPEAVAAAICSFPSIGDAVDTVIQIIQLGVPIARVELLDGHTVRIVNRHKLALREAHAADGVPRLARRREGAGRDRAGHRGRARRRRLRMGRHARGAHAPVDGAAQRLLRRRAKPPRLPLHHHRRVRAHLAPGRRAAGQRAEPTTAASPTSWSATWATATSTWAT
jgi:D-lactate dehydrogenase (cytochrome)